jgi:hypothetical protein
LSENKYTRKNKRIFNSHFTLAILSKLYQGYRPSQIATQLGVTPQDIYYHTDRMVDADLLYKDTSNGIKWKLTEKGSFILKQKLTGSVNSFNNYQIARIIPTRIDNLSFAFKILSPIPEDPHLDWTSMKNGVSRCNIKYETHTIDLVRSEKGAGSYMTVHLNKIYCYDWTAEIIKQYNLAIHYAKQAATKFRIEISDYGKRERRPHFAFEEDLIANIIATSNTSEARTGEDDASAWIDSSNGNGELETNDTDYAYDYLMMPKTIREIADVVMKASKFLDAKYERHYHPILTRNN